MHRFALLFLAAFALAGCQAAPPAQEAGYPLKGFVVASDAARGEVSVDCKPIPGYMDAMTMSFKLAQPGIAGELHPGDQINARLRVSETSSVLDQIVITAQAKPDYKPARFYNVPKPGQAVPDFKLRNQDGKLISLDQFRGKVLLVTFIYTRCPLPDYCIRMSRNFAAIQKQLAADPQLDSRVHLLTISFDPAYDTPKVLRNYGNEYAARSGGNAFSHWDFAVPPASELNAVDEFFDVGVSGGSNRTLVHSLSTSIITPGGAVFRWYPDNNWDPSAVVNDIRQAVAQTPASLPR